MCGIFGAGGFGREVLPEIYKLRIGNQEIADSRNIKYYFVEDKPSKNVINQVTVISTDDFLKLDSGNKYFTTAVGEPSSREKISKYLLSNGVRAISIQQSNSIVYESSTVGQGSILCSNSIVTANSNIGDFFHLNIFSYVAHDCIIGNYVTFSPQVSCSGNVIIGDNVFIGTGAIIRPGTPTNPLVIGSGSVIGMGSVITKSIPDKSLVYGNPAKVVKKLD